MKVSASYRTVKKSGITRHRCVVSIGGKESVKGTYDTQDEAWAEVFRQRDLIKAGAYAPGKYTFGQAVDHWFSYKEVKPITEYAWRTYLRKTLGDFLPLPLGDVAQMRQEVNDAIFDHPHAKILRSLVKGTCDLAMAEGRIDGHRLAMMSVKSRPRRERPLIQHTAGQLNTILAGIHPEHRLVILLQRGCGLRIGEALAMETDALHNGYLQVKRGTSRGFDGLPKMRNEGFIPRVVPVPYWLSPVIGEHVERYAANGVLFPVQVKNTDRGHGTKYFSAAALARHFRNAARNAGLPVDHDHEHLSQNFTFHQLRKNWATQLRNEAPSFGIQFEDIEQWLGHKNLTRDVYAFQGDDAIERGRKLSDPRTVK